MNIDQALALAMQHHQNGALEDAEELYRRILATDPNHAGALHLLGLIAWQAGQLDPAADLIRRAIAQSPRETVFLSNLSKLEMQRAAADPAQTRARQQEAIELQRQVIRLDPAEPMSHFDLGAHLQAAGDMPAAEASYREALRLKPDYGEAANNLGVVVQIQGRIAEAGRYFQQALALKPQSAEAHANLASVLQASGQLDQAIAAFREAVRLNPGHVPMRFALANALAETGRSDEAILVYQQVLKANPRYAEAHNNLGNACKAQRRLDEAAGAYRQAIALRPDLAEACSNLACIFDAQALHDEAIAHYRRAVELKPDSPRLHSNLVYALHFHPGSTPRSLLEEHRAWSRRHAEPPQSAIQPHANDPAPGRRLRIGYVSPNFRNHSVGRFMLPLLEAHDRRSFEVFCYTDGRAVDALTHRMRAAVHHWHSIAGLSDLDAAALVRSHQIDILVDLNMHMDSSRLVAFAQKPAPVQVTYLAYCSTTGLASIDYRLTDPHLDPPDSDPGIYTEKSHHLESYWCYAAMSDSPPVNPLPARQTGIITFGCFNSFSKASQAALETWVRILQTVPNSQLLLHAEPGSHRARVSNLLSAMGVDPGRCQFVPSGPTPEYFRRYHQIDIALDPFPYAGGTTTCDALWMGVPVITLRGAMAVGRGGVSILSQLDLQEFIAATPDEYVSHAAALARDLPRLEHLRAMLRPRMERSPLMDAPRLARNIESAYRQFWQTWCSNQRSSLSPPTSAAEQLFQKALPLHQSGRLAEAQPVYEQVLALAPDHHPALHNLGVIRAQLGQLPAALELVSRARALRPADPSYHCNYAKIAFELKQYPSAAEASREALRLDPRMVEAHLNLAVALHAMGHLDESITSFREALALNPNIASAYLHLSNALADKGELDAAIDACRHGLRLNPADASGHAHLGNLLNARGQLDEAMAACQHALRLNPNLAAGHNNLGCSLMKRRQIDQAAAEFRQAITLDPEMLQAYANLGGALHDRGDLDEAIAVGRQGLQLDSAYPDALHNLGVCLKDSGRIEEAIAVYRRALELRPNNADAHSNLIYILHLHPGVSAQVIRQELAAFNARHAAPLAATIQPHTNDRDPDRRLRIGYLSGDFREHPVGRFLLPLLAHHDRMRVEIFCYSTTLAPDSVTQRFRELSQQWRDLTVQSDAQAAELVRRDQIDILIDLAMYTDGNRLKLFARKPAPVQATWLAYPGSTGLSAIDYRLSDPYLDPQDADLSVYSEATLRLPETFWCYHASPEAPGVNPLPALQNGYITFGSLNNFCKVSTPARQLWADLLARLPDSRLLIHAAPGSHREEFLQPFVRAGISPDRITFLPRLTPAGYFGQYHNIDIALDPFPCVGGTTTCDALFMGVPVITLAGQTAIARGGVSILSNLGLPELIARTPEQYLHIATTLSADLSRLEHLRQTLRPRMQAAPLMNAPRFAQNIESAYRDMWQTWCARP